eukprot:jgi/Chlat1/9221/Chrsp98S08478
MVSIQTSLTSNHELNISNLEFVETLNAYRNAKKVGVEKKNVQTKKFDNGDVYVGEWKEGKPHGKGKYDWADRSWYDGDWIEGQQYGRGSYAWASGAKYEGDWVDGYMQGMGTYIAVDGASYIGSWLKDQKHGLGIKRYSSGDVYEGLWRDDMHEGPGRFRWANGNEYSGEWVAGCMSGRGTFVWANGDRYDGEWKNNKEDGQGRFTWADGSVYEGTWSSGLKHGTGTYYAAVLLSIRRARRHLKQTTRAFSQQDPLEDKLELTELQKLHDPLVEADETGLDTEADGEAENEHTSGSESGDPSGAQTAPRAGRRWHHRSLSAPSGREDSGTEAALDRLRLSPAPQSEVEGMPSIRDNGASSMEENKSGDNAESKHSLRKEGEKPVVLRREYHHGILVNEVVEMLDKLPRLHRKTRRRRRRRVNVKRAGETIFKGHRSYDLMLNLQLGIRYSVGKITPVPLRPLTKEDFSSKATLFQRFPHNGSSKTPPHPSGDFKWKDYCPMVFRLLRERFTIDAGDYMMSLCGDQALRELASPGKSGSVFFLSADDRFIIKTMRKHEMHSFLNMLPAYFRQVMEYDDTLLTKFYGLHRIKPHKGRKVRFMVMGNLFRSELPMHMRFDLKGSTLGRLTDTAKRNELTILKDLDLEWYFKLETGWREKLLRQLEADCDFLTEQRIMDYSLLLGIHVRKLREVEKTTEVMRSWRRESMSEDELINLSLSYRKSSQRSLTTSPSMQLANIKPISVGQGGTDALAFAYGKTRVQLGVNMAATMIPMKYKDKEEQCPKNELQDVVLFFGIIDILQEYNIAKHLEHSYKSLFQDGNTISAIDPDSYAQRFVRFVGTAFA